MWIGGYVYGTVKVKLIAASVGSTLLTIRIARRLRRCVLVPKSEFDDLTRRAGRLEREADLLKRSRKRDQVETHVQLEEIDDRIGELERSARSP